MAVLTERLSRLVALANRPGTEAEGIAARARAEKLAAERGLAVVDVRGTLLVVEEFRADLLRRLLHIADGSPAAGELDP